MIAKFYRLFLYRPLMRFTHRFGWHYMTKSHLEPDTVQHWCQWCGIRDETLTPAGIQNIMEEMSNGKMS